MEARCDATRAVARRDAGLWPAPQGDGLVIATDPEHYFPDAPRLQWAPARDISLLNERRIAGLAQTRQAAPADGYALRADRIGTI